MTESEKNVIGIYHEWQSTVNYRYTVEQWEQKFIQGFGGYIWRRKRGHLENLDVDSNIILKWSIKQYVEGFGLDASGSGEGHVAGSCDHGKPWGSRKCRDFLD
jgi:hypothetical protein